MDIGRHRQEQPATAAQTLVSVPRRLIGLLEKVLGISILRLDLEAIGLQSPGYLAVTTCVLPLRETTATRLFLSGWSMQSRQKTDVVLQALLMAVWRIRPKEKVLVHSD